MTSTRMTHIDSLNSFIQRRINSAVRTVLYKNSVIVLDLREELKEKQNKIESLVQALERETQLKMRENKERERLELENRSKDSSERELKNQLICAQEQNVILREQIENAKRECERKERERQNNIKEEHEKKLREQSERVKKEHERELEQKQREHKENEQKDRERKEREKKELEKKARLLNEQKERELKDREHKDNEKKLRDQKERERIERQKKEMEQRDQEALELFGVSKETSKKGSTPVQEKVLKRETVPNTLLSQKDSKKNDDVTSPDREKLNEYDFERYYQNIQEKAPADPDTPGIHRISKDALKILYDHSYRTRRENLSQANNTFGNNPKKKKKNI